MLEMLKKRGNPYYQFYDDYNTFTNRCKKSDKRGYSFVFDEDVDSMIDISEINKYPFKQEDICIEEKIERDYKENDPVKKYQFDDYNKSLCMSNMYPENSVIIAPGRFQKMSCMTMTGTLKPSLI